MRERIGQVCDHAFEETFQNDPCVIVVRKVQAKLAVFASHAVPDSRLAEQLGARLCASVVRAIVSSDGENVVRFENQAAYVSGFLSNFVGGTAWVHWYHGAFHSLRALPPDQAILAVLVENLDCLGEILHRLTVANSLVAVLAGLGPDGQRQLWLRFTRQTTEAPSEDAVCIFVHSAFHLVDSLSLWASSRPSEQQFLSEYLQSHPSNPQWTDPSSLAAAVVEVLRALSRAAWLPRHHTFGPQELARLDSALAASCDWLDKSVLKKSIVALLSPDLPQMLTRSITRRPPVPTPAQLGVLRSLLSALRDRTCQFDPAEENPHTHLLRLLASLTSGPLASPSGIPFLESIVQTWLILRSSPHRDSDLLNLSRGQIDSLLAALPPAERIRLRAHLESVSSAGEPAVAVVEELLAQSSAKPLTHALDVATSTCAGLFLLVRTIQDLRLSAVLIDSGFDSLEPLLVALSLRLAGPPALEGGKFDAGAALWSGVVAEEFPTFLTRLADLDAEGFRARLMHLIDAQRLIDPSPTLGFADQPLPRAFSPELSNLLDFTAAALLHAWARWLPGLSGSSVGFLLEKFIHRSGTLQLYADRIEVTLAPGPLDAILKMAGYLSDSPHAHWLGNRFVRFRAPAR